MGLKTKDVITACRRHESELLSGVAGRRVYFVNSYRAVASAANEEWVLATADYGEPFVAAVQRGNVAATQFHPEKSGEAGLRVLRNFLEPESAHQPQEPAAASAGPPRPLPAPQWFSGFRHLPEP